MTIYYLNFETLDVGDSFIFDGRTWIKKSTRTAYQFGRPEMWFYFRNKDRVSFKREMSEEHISYLEATYPNLKNYWRQQ